MRKKILFFLIIVYVFYGQSACFAESQINSEIELMSLTNSNISTMMNELKKTYYSGSHWNHKSGESYNGYSVSGTPCGSDGYTCNELYGGKQCYAFARHLANIIFGSYPTVGISNVGDEYVSNGWVAKKGSSITSIQPGDIISFGSTTHTAICWYTSGETIYVAECWGSAKYGCQIEWGYFNGNSENSTLTKMKSNGLVGVWKHPLNGGELVPSKPMISSVTVSNEKVTVNWNSVSNATNYDVFIVESPWGTENIIASLNTNSTSCTFDIHKEGSFCAFVAAKNSEGNAGESSEWYSFTVTPSPPNAPVLDKGIANNDYYISDTITASWSAASNAKDYEYFLAQYPTGYAYGTTKVKGGTVTGTSVSFKSLPIGRYSLFVVAKNSGGSSPQSNWVTFTVNPTDYIPKMVTYNNNHIYAVYDYSTNWDYARSLCEYFGGHLATVTSKEENDLITSIIQYGGCDGYWLGGSDYKSGDYGKDYVPYFWLNGETFSYSNWADGEPSRTGNEGYKEHFLTVRKSYGNKWNDESALSYDNKGFILEIEMDSADMDNMRFGNNEYIRFDKNMNWIEAETYCNSLGGHLVTYESKEEYSAVTDFMDNGKKKWFHIGASKNRNDWYWISNDKLIENDYLKLWSYYDPYGEYLMEYVGVSAKESGAFGKFAGLKNAYSPFKHKENLGFVCEIDNYYADIPTPALWSITSYNGDTVIITAPLDAVSGEKNYLYAAGYSNNGELIDFDMIEFVVESGKIKYELSGLKEIKGSKVELMLWNSDMQPLSNAFEK